MVRFLLRQKTSVFTLSKYICRIFSTWSICLGCLGGKQCCHLIHKDNFLCTPHEFSMADTGHAGEMTNQNHNKTVDTLSDESKQRAEELKEKANDFFKSK